MVLTSIVSASCGQPNQGGAATDSSTTAPETSSSPSLPVTTSPPTSPLVPPTHSTSVPEPAASTPSVSDATSGADDAVETSVHEVNTSTAAATERDDATTPASASGTESAPESASKPEPSGGCEVVDVEPPCDTSGAPCTIQVDGIEREYYVVLPNDYDANREYPVVFQFHPLGGNAEQGMNMYRVRPEFPDAIYVTPDGLASGNNQGWPNTNGQDEALTRAIVARIEAQYCTDRARYFSTGFSYGGSMSFTAALCMSDLFRAIGAMAGAPISGAGQCDAERPVAAWINHGEEDTALPMNLAIPLRDELIQKNGCSNETVPVEPAPCVEYQGCDAGYPVVWCQQPGVGHAIPNYGAAAIATFFKQF